jgi:small subunit ribosomal protein S5
MNRGMPGGRGKRKRTPEEEAARLERNILDKEKALNDWVPKTELGRMVKAGKINSLDEIFDKGHKIMEPEIVDSLVKLDAETVEISKTTRVVLAGRKFSYRATVIVGNKDGYIGIGTGKDADRFPAANKATRDAKLNIKRIFRGSGSWEEQATDEKHSIPFKVIGECGSVRVKLMPAPKGTGLAVGKNIRSVLVLAGVKNVWGKTKGRSSIRLNFVRAALDALEQTGRVKSSKDIQRKLAK